MKWLSRIFLACLDRWGPPRRLHIIAGDSVPQNLPSRDLVLAREDGEDWAVGMTCPCGCGRRIELLTIQEARPRWDYQKDADGRPSLHPSVWLKDGCKSHFWVRAGRIVWAGRT